MKRLLLCVVAALSIGCGTTKESATPPAQDLRRVTLPDISNTAAPVQAQLRERYASLTRAIDDPATSTGARAAAYGDMGKLFLAAEYFDAAEACFVNARTLAPSDMRWPYYLGHVFRSRNDTAKAIASFEDVLKLQPDHVPSLVWLAEMHLAASRPDDAAAALTKAAAIQPESAAVIYGLGRVALAKQDNAQAATYLEKALALSPSASRIHYPLAMAYRALGNREKAEAHLRLRGETDLPPVDPLMTEVTGLLQSATAYETRGLKAVDARQWPEAVESLRTAVALSPANALTRLNLGTSLYMVGNADAALEQYREAIRLSPSLARAHFGVGVIMETRRRDRDAIAAFSAAVQNDPAYLEARFSLANALRRTGQVRESLAHYDEVLRLNPAVSQADFGYAMGLVRLGRYQEARARLEKAVRAFRDQPGFAHALARVLAAAPDERARDGAAALKIAEDLLKIQRTPALTETMAMALAEVGRFEEAARWQAEAIDSARQSGRQEMVAHLTDNLRRYQSRQPCRVPWTDDDPVHHPEPAAQ